jgi:multidrug efflux pump
VFYVLLRTLAKKFERPKLAPAHGAAPAAPTGDHAPALEGN